MRRIDYPVDAAYEGKKLYSFLKGEAKLSSKLIRTLKQCDDGLQINGVHARTIDLLHTGDTVTVHLPADAHPAKPGSTLPDILYEDDDLLIVNKPALMPIHESHNHQGDTLQNCVALYDRQRQTSGAFRAVGRLDFSAEGVHGGGVAVAVAEKGHHRFDDLGGDARGGVVVEIDYLVHPVSSSLPAR